MNHTFATAQRGATLVFAPPEHQLGAFKWRGALATLEAHRPDVVVTASTGNHGAAVAYAAADNLLPDFPLINKSFELCYACADR